VYFDRATLDDISSGLLAAADMLRHVHAAMKHGDIPDDDFDNLMTMRDDIAMELAKFDKGVGIIPSQREEMRELEAEATKIIATVMPDGEWDAQQAA
jgi:hypothetical protein